jgi:hypothetical protein
MSNILKKYNKEGVITTGDDNVQLDSPTFEIINVSIDTVNSKLRVEVLHEVMQGILIRKHSRDFNINFADLPASVKTAGKAFLDAIEAEILALPQYADSVPE